MSNEGRLIYPGESPSESSTSAISRMTAPRVNQLDCEDLDFALVGMLSDKLTRSLDNFKSTFSNGYKLELELLIKLIIFKCGIWSKVNASPGSKLQNLKIVSTRTNTPTRRTLLLFLLLHPPIFPNYLITRIREYALSNQWSDLPNHDYRKKIYRLIGKLENIGRIWELVGWLGFLWDGKYPSLLMRILRLRLIPSSPHVTRLVSYEFMNRQLVWSAFTEFLMFSIPLIPPLPPSLNPSAHFNRFKSLLTPPPIIDYTSVATSSTLLNSNGGREEEDKHTGIYANLPKPTCPICYSRNSTAPVPLSSTGQGADLTLPPIQGAQDSNFGHIHDRPHDNQKEQEETRIFIPAQTDCKGDCKWCYYCIGEELYKHHERIKATTASKGGKGRKMKVQKNESGKAKDRKGKDEVKALDEKQEEEEEEAEDKWECLRCGGGVTRAWRVGLEGIFDEITI